MTDGLIEKYQKYPNEKLDLLISFLREFISPNKSELIEKILPNRTRYLTVVLEDIFQPHNASAVIRSCESFGVQDIHIIEGNNRYRVNPDITLGSTKWVDIYRYNKENNDNTEACLSSLKQKGYKIVATTLKTESIAPENIPITEKLALCFGKEDMGLSEKAHQIADYFIKIPMLGFTQSLNLSVSAAVCMYDIVKRMRQEKIDSQLNDREMRLLKIQWYFRIIKNPEKYLEQFRQYAIDEKLPDK